MDKLSAAINKHPNYFIGVPRVKEMFSVLSSGPKTLAELINYGFSRSGAERALRAFERAGLVKVTSHMDHNLVYHTYEIKS